MSARPILALVAVLGCSSHPEDPLAEPRTFPSAPAPHSAPPWTLTASDGTGLQLVRVDAKAVVEGPLAFTELHLYFHNPEDRTLEGRFAITLPARAAVSRLAMEHAGQLQEGEVVPKALARRAYEDFLHRRQDPALLEKAAGNELTARVFPIPARSNKHLVISFSQELPGEYVLPLRGLPSIERIDIQLDATRPDGARATQELHERKWQPDRDFTAGIVGPAAVSSGNLVVAQVPITAMAAVADAPRALTLLVDTSASRALGFAGYVRSIGDLVTALRERYASEPTGEQVPLGYGDLALRVVAFDQETHPIYDGRAADFGDAQLAALFERGAAGASDLGQALESARASTMHRIVVVTDGVVTAGLAQPELVAAAARVADRLDIVLAGGIRDERLAAALARAGRRPGDVFDLDRGASGVAIGLGETVLVDVAITIPGATWVYPRTLPTARAGGDPTTVFARMALPVKAIEIVAGTERRTLGLVPAAPAMIQRALAGAEIEELERQLEATTGPATATLREEIARRSVAARVVSSQSAMLVLESDEDYQRYGIDRTALADILVVGPQGIEQTRRRFVAKREPPEPDEPATEDRTARVAVTHDIAPPPADSGTAMALEEGTMGRKERGEDPQLTRQQAIEEARNAGVLGSADTLRGGLSSLTGTGDISSGFSNSNSYGQLLDGESGSFGYGRSGHGAGGGATGWGTIGGRGGMRGRTSAVPTVRLGAPTTQGALDQAIIRRYLKRNLQKIQYCYEKELLAKPTLRGTVTARFVIGETGTVEQATASGVDPAVADCVAKVVNAIEFPRPTGGSVQVSYPFAFQLPADGAFPVPPAARVQPAAALPSRMDPDPLPARMDPEPPPLPPEPPPRPAANDRHDPLTGKLAQVMQAIAKNQVDDAFAIATRWRTEAPGDVLALVALGETLEARKELAAAARIYGSIIDLFPARADFRRFAGERLERLAAHVPSARRLAIDTYRRGVADRPDHVTGHRLLAYALLRAGDHAGAYAAILAGFDQPRTGGRFLGADRVLGEDVGMIAAAYLANGGPRTQVAAALAQRSLELATRPSTRFVVYWETDANDVDFHIRDENGGHASYTQKQLLSGGELYADITTGYGPECFTIPGTPSAGPYELSLHYYSQGPMGFGMGLLQIQRFDGKGGLTFEDRPYVIMTDRAFVDLGTTR